MLSGSWPQVDNAQMSLRCKKKLIFLDERTITPQGVKPQKQNVQNFLEETKFPKSKKALQRYLEILELLQKLCPETFRTPCPILQDAEK